MRSSRSNAESICGASVKWLLWLSKAQVWLGSPSLPTWAPHPILPGLPIPFHLLGQGGRRTSVTTSIATWTAQDPGWEPTSTTAAFRWVFLLTDRAIHLFLRWKSCLRTRHWQCPAQSRGLPVGGLFLDSPGFRS